MPPRAGLSPLRSVWPASVVNKYLPRLVRSGDPRIDYGDLGRGLVQFRTREEANLGVTVEDLQALAREIFQSGSAFPVLVLPSRKDEE